MADSILMSEFEELEGLQDQDDDNEDLDHGDEDDADFKPVQAASLRQMTGHMKCLEET